MNVCTERLDYENVWPLERKRERDIFNERKRERASERARARDEMRENAAKRVFEYEYEYIHT